MQSNSQPKKEFRIRTVREVLEEDAKKKQVKKGNKPKEPVAEQEAKEVLHAAEPPALDETIDDELVFEI